MYMEQMIKIVLHVSVTLCVGETTDTRIKQIVFILFQNKGVIHRDTQTRR